MKYGFSLLGGVARKLEKAKSLFNEGDDVKAFSSFADLASKGNAEAAYYVGQCYLRGKGVPPSLEEGARWTHRAAQGNIVEAYFSLATIYAVGVPEKFDLDTSFTSISGLSALDDNASRKPDFRKAIYWAEKGADARHVESQALLAHLLRHSPEELCDAERSRYWYQKSADAGSLHGCLGIGLFLLSEAKTDKDKQKAVYYIEKAAHAEVGTACATMGWLYETGFAVSEKNEEKSAGYYKIAAEKGVTQAQSRYGVMLLKGIGVEANAVRAETWLRRAAYGGDAEASAMLGDLYVRGKEFLYKPIEAAEWYRLAAENGHTAAARALSLLYLTGTGVSKDPEKSAYWLNVAAVMGDVKADADLGNLILSGVSSPQDYQVRLQKRFKKLAESGDPLGAFNLGVCLFQGVGTDVDARKALYWMGQALEGVVNAQYWYARMLMDGKGVEADPVQAFVWFEKAAWHGMPEACVTLADLLITGEVKGQKDHPRALKLYHKAAEKGDVKAFFSLGAMYGGGHDVPEDREKARGYFEEAAIRGHPLGQMMFGRYLLKGLGGPKDRRQAEFWLERAVEQNVKEAEQFLEKISLGRELRA